jgi:DNA-binding transcriptional MerR regulator
VEASVKRRAGNNEPNDNEETARIPKYTIGIVAQLLRLPPQALRRFEEAGLLDPPARQAGKNRLYSDFDLAILEEIAELSDQGINAIGIRYILQIRQEVRVLRQEIEIVRSEKEQKEEQ